MKRTRNIASVILIVFGLAGIVLFYLSTKLPVIDSIKPLVFVAGEEIHVLGRNFGKKSGNGIGKAKLLLDGAALTNSSYLAWEEHEIVFLLPSSIDSGLLQVQTSFGKSKPEVLIAQHRLPIKPAGLPHAPTGPSILSVAPQEAGVGALVEIRGINFGSEFLASQVLFSRNPGLMALDSPMDRKNALEESANFVQPENSLMYESWDDKVIAVRVPEEAGSGPLVVSTPHGLSEPFSLSLSQNSGSKYRFNPVTYTLGFELEIRRKDSGSDGALVLHAPNPANSFSQSFDEVQEESHPSSLGSEGRVSLIRVEGPIQGLTRISRTLQVTVHNVETELSSYKEGFAGPYANPSAPGTAPLFLQPYLNEESLLPSGSKEIKSLAAQIIGRERNLQKKAALIHAWLVSRMKWVPGTSSEGTISQALKERLANTRDYVLLAASLFRATGIPAVPISGFLAGEDESGIPHFWMEYYLPSIGWVPYDPVLSRAGKIQGFLPPFDNPSLYFGALDNRHIAIERGVESRASRSNGLRPDARALAWTFLPLLDEASQMEYSSTWRPMRILARY